VRVTSKNHNVRIGFPLLTIQLLLVIAYIGMQDEVQSYFIIMLYCMLTSILPLVGMLVAVWL